MAFFLCSKCRRGSREERYSCFGLMDHIASFHFNESALFRCPTPSCDYRFATVSSWIRHMTVCSGEAIEDVLPDQVVLKHENFTTFAKFEMVLEKSMILSFSKTDIDRVDMEQQTEILTFSTRGCQTQEPSFRHCWSKRTRGPTNSLHGNNECSKETLTDQASDGVLNSNEVTAQLQETEWEGTETAAFSVEHEMRRILDQSACGMIGNATNESSTGIGDLPEGLDCTGRCSSASLDLSKIKSELVAHEDPAVCTRPASPATQNCPSPSTYMPCSPAYDVSSPSAYTPSGYCSAAKDDKYYALSHNSYDASTDFTSQMNSISENLPNTETETEVLKPSNPYAEVYNRSTSEQFVTSHARQEVETQSIGSERVDCESVTSCGSRRRGFDVNENGEYCAVKGSVSSPTVVDPMPNLDFFITKRKVEMLEEKHLVTHSPSLEAFPMPIAGASVSGSYDSICGLTDDDGYKPKIRKPLLASNHLPLQIPLPPPPPAPSIVSPEKKKPFFFHKQPILLPRKKRDDEFFCEYSDDSYHQSIIDDYTCEVPMPRAPAGSDTVNNQDVHPLVLQKIAMVERQIAQDNGNTQEQESQPTAEIGEPCAEKLNVSTVVEEQGCTSPSQSCVNDLHEREIDMAEASEDLNVSEEARKRSELSSTSEKIEMRDLDSGCSVRQPPNQCEPLTPVASLALSARRTKVAEPLDMFDISSMEKSEKDQEDNHSVSASRKDSSDGRKSSRSPYKLFPDLVDNEVEISTTDEDLQTPTNSNVPGAKADDILPLRPRSLRIKNYTAKNESIGSAADLPKKRVLKTTARRSKKPRNEPPLPPPVP